MTPSQPNVKLWDGAKTLTLAADNSTNSNAKIPVLAAVANAAAPSYTEGAQAPLSIDLAGNLRLAGSITKAGSSSVTGVAASATSVALLAANANRLGASITNDSSSSLLYVKLGATAAANSGGYTIALLPGAYWEVPFNYTGAIAGIWSAATGFANVDELTA